MAPPLTAMNGLLVRGPTGWAWRDGTPEPRVRDLHPREAYQFPRVRHAHPEREGEREEFVSVPDEALRDEPDLAEFVFNLSIYARPAPFDPGHTEVPADRWDAWADSAVIGVVWDPADEAPLMALAEEHKARGG